MGRLIVTVEPIRLDLDSLFQLSLSSDNLRFQRRDNPLVLLRIFGSITGGARLCERDDCNVKGLTGAVNTG